MYFYPDKDDAVTLNVTIKNTEPYPGYWQQSENKALLLFEKLLQHTEANNSLLDLGAGEGRLTIRFASHFKNITALEPDQERIARAKKNCVSAGISNVTFLESQFLDAKIPENSFEVILCSHIIQHVPTTSIKSMLEKIHAILKPDGIFILMTNHTKENNDVFEKQRDVAERTDEQTFNQLTENTLGFLPVHYFTIKHLENLLVDFQIKKRWLFHDESKRHWPDALCFRDTILNFFNIPFGRDILIIAKKGSNSVP